MKSTAFFVIVLAVLTTVLVLGGCQRQAPTPQDTVSNEPVYNETLNNELEGMTQPDVPAFKEFMFEYKQRNESKYELAETDVITLLGQDLNASDVSVFGVMLGDSYETVLEYLGVPDVMYTAADKSYKNLEYGKKIGIGDKQTAITYHLEGDLVTQINIRKTFAKYLQGNTSIGTPKETFYTYLDLPDYTDFTSYHRVMVYVENGVSVYLFRDKLDILSLTEPKQFKGVKYVTSSYEASPGIWFNQTKPVLIE